jgi:hypothetical protein
LRPKLFSGFAIFFALVSVALLAVLFGPSLLTERNEGASPQGDKILKYSSNLFHYVVNEHILRRGNYDKKQRSGSLCRTPLLLAKI